MNITIEKEQDKYIFDIYRKPATTYSIIPCDSFYPTEHKTPPVKYLTNRMNKYYLSTANKDKRKKIIKHILQENEYHTSIIDIPPQTSKQQNKNWIKVGKIYICWQGN